MLGEFMWLWHVCRCKANVWLWRVCRLTANLCDCGVCAGLQQIGTSLVCVMVVCVQVQGKGGNSLVYVWLCAGARQGGQLLCVVVACIQAQGKGGNSLVCVTVACVCRRKARGATPFPWAAWRASCLGATHQSSGKPSWSSWTSRLHRQRWSSNRPPRRRSEWQSLWELRNGLNGEAVGSVPHTRTPTHKHACMHTLATPHAHTQTHTHMQACMRKHTLATTHTHTHTYLHPPTPPTHTYTHTCTHSCTLVPPPPTHTHTHTHYSGLNSVHYVEADLCSHFQSELRNGLNGEAVVVGSVPHTRTPTHKHACMHTLATPHAHTQTHTHMQACMRKHTLATTHTHTYLHPPPPRHTLTHTLAHTHAHLYPPPPPTHTHTHYSCLNSVHYVEADLCSHFQSDCGGGAAWYRSLQEAEGEGPARDLHQLCRHADQAVQEGQRHRLPQTK